MSKNFLVLCIQAQKTYSALLSVEIQSSDHLHYFPHLLTLEFLCSVKKKKIFIHFSVEILMGGLWWYALSENVQKTPYATVGFT